jgi:hypothetical protein
VSPFRHQRRKYEKNNLQEELRKINQQTFDCKKNTGEGTEAWLLGIIKYIQLHNYSSNLESRITIYNYMENILFGGTR